MHFIDDKDAVTVAGRVEIDIFDDRLANVVNTGVRSRVDLKHIDRAALGDLDARRARRRII